MSRHAFLPIVLAVLLAALVPASCAPAASPAAAASQPGATPNAVDAAATLSAIENGAEDGGQAADFGLKSIDGADVSLSGLRGRGVIVAFWATWCDYCREELPLLSGVYEEMHDAGIEVLAVNVADEPERILAFVAELELPYPVLMDPRGEVADLYRVRGLPTTVFIDSEGVVQRVHLGTIDEETLRFFAGALLPEQG